MTKLTKILAIVAVIELAACGWLGYSLTKQKKTLDEQTKAAQEAQASLTTIAGQYDTLQKTTVPAANYNRLTNDILSLKNAAVASGKLSPSIPASTPEQVCAVLRQLLQQPPQPAPVAVNSVMEVDFLVGVVEKEIAAAGVVDCKQPEKFALPLYHIQKVLDAIGYKLTSAMASTDLAVVKFQTDNQLKPDGRIGAKTWAKVREIWDAKKTRQ